MLSALVGAAITAGTAWLRQHYGARMAARLIYAELTRNSAPIIYFRQTGAWSANPVADSAWNTYGKDLARGREADEFDAVYRGYAAFPALEYIQAHSDIAGHDELFDTAVEDVCGALHTVGRRARIRHEKVRQRIERMGRRAAESNGSSRSEAVMPAALLESIATYGTSTQQSWAYSTIAASPQLSGLQRVVLDAHAGDDPEAFTVARREGQGPTGDVIVDEAYDAVGTTAGFYREVYGVELTPEGTELTTVVHYRDHFVNCFWDGSRMVVGDGDGQLFGRFTAALDVIAHELSHGVMARTGLDYGDQSGAVLESLCDVFGVMCKQYARGQREAATADWLLGEEIMLRGGALRSLAEPGTAYDDPVIGRDQQPAHMDGYLDGAAALLNCGIANRAFYLTATALPGPAWETAGWIWIEAAMSGRLRAKSGFSAFAGLTLGYAKEHWDPDGPVVEAVRAAWREVGVRPRSPARAKAAATD